MSKKKVVEKPVVLRTCNQCGKHMEFYVEVSIGRTRVEIPVCTEACCPNFGLLQVSMENIHGKLLECKTCIVRDR